MARRSKRPFRVPARRSQVLRRLREGRGLTAEELGLAMGLSPQAYKQLEIGRRTLSPARLQAFAAATDSDPAALALSWSGQSHALAVLCADNKAASIAIAALQDLFDDLGADFLELTVAELVGAFEGAKRQLQCAALARNMADSSGSDLLTPRQLECLQWVQCGKSSRDIGSILKISRRTVESHIRTACERLRVRTRPQAVSVAIQLGLLSPRPLC